MKLARYFVLLLMVVCQALLAHSQNYQKKGPPMDIVFILDVSSSTGGILESIQDNFWAINNEIARLKPLADYRIGIVGMGRPSFKPETNYVSIISDLTDDVDYAAGELFQFKDLRAKGKVNIGDGIYMAVKNLSWSKDPNAIKLAFLVGNGAVDNGYNINKACALSVGNDITVHMLYLQTYVSPRELPVWKELADTCHGNFNLITLQQKSRIVFEKNYDNDLLLEAINMMNSTYVYYGKKGKDRAKNRDELDYRAALVDDMTAEARGFFKATDLYQGKNSAWDLVDLSMKKNIDYSIVQRHYLPPELQEMSYTELKQYVEEKRYERQEYVTIIKMLTTKREEFLKQKREKMQKYLFGDTFFGVVNKTIINTATEKGYSFDY